MTADAHASGCSWHLDQYPFECDCGAYTGRLNGTVTIDRQVFEAIHATLTRKAFVFAEYAELHKDKKSVEGDRKALANAAHCRDITRVLGLIEQVAATRRYVSDSMDLAYERVRESGREPVAFIMTHDFARDLVKEWRERRHTWFPFGYGDFADIITVATLRTSRYRDCEIFVVDEPKHSALICCSEDSPLLASARVLCRAD